VSGIPQGIGFSHDGGAAVFSFEATAKAVVYTGLPDAPRLAAEFSTVDWPAEVTALSVSSDGNRIAGITRSGEAYLLATPDGPIRRLLLDDTFVSSLLFWRGEQLLLLDAGGSRVLTIENPRQGTGAVELAAIAPAISSNTRLAAGEGNSLLVLDGSQGRFWQIGPAQWSAELHTYAVEPFSEASRIRDHGSFLLATGGRGPGRIVMTTDSMRIHYVPAIAPAAPPQERSTFAGERRQP
jgi:hypothetical protein